MELNSDLLSPCGLYCGVCGMYYATRDNNQKFLEKLVGVYQGKIPWLDREITAADLECKGCLSDKVSVFCRDCFIKECAKEKKLKGCHQCDDYPCEYIEKFPLEVGKKVIERAVPFRREHGDKEWVVQEETRYLCPDCGHQIFRGAKRCNKCKTALDLD